LRTNKSSAIADMAAQCCTIRIFLLSSGVSVFDVLFLSNLWKYRYVTYCQKLYSLTDIIVAEV